MIALLGHQFQPGDPVCDCTPNVRFTQDYRALEAGHVVVSNGSEATGVTVRAEQRCGQRFVEHRVAIRPWITTPQLAQITSIQVGELAVGEATLKPVRKRGLMK